MNNIFLLNLKKLIYDKKIIFGVALLTISGLILSIIFITNQSKGQKNHPTSKRIQKSLADTKVRKYFSDIRPLIKKPKTKKSKVKEVPEFNIKTYSSNAPLPLIPSDINLYTFKTNFSEKEIISLAQRVLGKTNNIKYSQDKTEIYLSNDFGEINFNLITGSFTLISFRPIININLANDNQTKLEQISDYLRNDLEFIDATVTGTAYYIRKSTPGLTYFEFHRTNAGLPIINPIGLITMSESKKINTLSFTDFSDSDADDPSIILASDRPGKARRNDFNTLTVGIGESYLSIESNLRWIEKIESIKEKNLVLLPAEKILDELKNKGTYFNLTLPAGVGYIDLNKVYPDNKLTSKKATITDIALAYFEKPLVPQKYLQPSYLVKGWAETETGIKVNFSNVIPAIENPQIYASSSKSINKLLASIKSLIKVAYAQEIPTTPIPSPTPLVFFCYDDSIECQGLSPTPAPSPTPTKIITTPTIYSPSPTIKTPSPTLKQITPTDAPKTPTSTPSIPIATQIPPSPTPRQLTPSPTPTPAPCVLYDKDGNPIETAYEFVLYDLSNYYEYSKLIESSEEYTTVAYFKQLSAGPLAFRVSSRKNPVKPSSEFDPKELFYDEASERSNFFFTPILSGIGRFAKQNKDLQNKIALSIAIRSAKKMIEMASQNPDAFEDIIINKGTLEQSYPNSPIYYFTSPPYIDLNLLFPESQKAIQNWFTENKFSGSNNFSLVNVQMQEVLSMLGFAINNTNGYTLEKLASNTDTLENIPINILFFSRFSGPDYLMSRDYLLDLRCKWFTPISPNIYFYTDNPLNISFSFDKNNITYSDPYVPKSGLNIYLKSRKKIYYEYSKIPFDKPNKGWIVKANELNSFIEQTFAAKLALNDKETKDLLEDIYASTIQTDKKNYIFVGLISEKQINRQIPISVKPNPNSLQRVHLYIEYLDKPLNIKAPKINPINRHGFAILELGVYVK